MEEIKPLKTFQEKALELYDLGYNVIPLRPKQKIPLMPWKEFQGKRPARKIVEGWWVRFPSANIGIVCGEVVVIDGDTLESSTVIAKRFPNLPKVRTRNGYHFYARQTEPLIKNCVNQKLKIDIRGVGGQVATPPSIHPKDNHVYAWETETGHPPPVNHLPIITAADIAPFLPEAKPKTPGDVWALLPRLVDQWKESNSGQANFCCPCHDDVNPSAGITIENGKLLFNCFAGCTFDTFLKKLDIPSSACFPPDENSILTPPTPQEVPYFPEMLSKPPGLVGDIAYWMDKTAMRPQPVFSIAAALALIGAVAGQRVQTDTGLRTNLYFIAVGDSGSGKDHARKISKQLLKGSGLQKHMGVDRFVSDSGILTLIKAKPSNVCFVDEFGRLLSGITKGNNPGSPFQKIANTLIEMFSTANSIFMGTARAGMSEEQMEEEQIEQPNLCVYGTTVPGRLFDSLSSNEILDGFLNRFLLVFTDNDYPERQKKIPPLPKELFQVLPKIQEFFDGDYESLMDEALNTCARVIPFTDTAEEFRDSFEKMVDANFLLGGKTKDLWVRTIEHAEKLALVVAVGDLSDEITEHHLKWAQDFTLWCLFRTVYECRIHIADSVEDAIANEIKQFVSDVYWSGNKDKNPRRCVKKESPTPSSLIYRKFRKYKQTVVNERIEMLLDAHEIQKVEIKNGNGYLPC